MTTEYAAADVEYADFNWIARTFGISRSRQYVLAGQGLIKIIRLGGRSRVEVASVRRFMRALPPAPIRLCSGCPVQ